MFRQIATGLALAALMGSAAIAETHEVQMLNRGAEGSMVFEPAFLRVAPGDTVRFIAADKGHNAQTVEGMIPDGAEAFAGGINQEVEVTLTAEGLYAVICKPHYAMGMVMTIAVGDVAEAPEGFLEGRIPRKALERFEAQLAGL